MNIPERIRLIKAMDFIAGYINDENIFYSWLSLGVADGDIEDPGIPVTQEEIENLECYVNDDDSFAETIGLFVRLMKRAHGSGNLYCDGVVGKKGWGDSLDKRGF
jgi:hypothetical protein